VKIRHFLFSLALTLGLVGASHAAFWQWSKNATSDDKADPTINWSEGMSPSSVNDSARAMMARLADYRDDVSGSLTTAGTATAYTVASNQGFTALANLGGATLTIVPHVTSGLNPTLSVDGLTAEPIHSATGLAVPAGTLIAGTPYSVTYYAATSEFILHGNVGVFPSATFTGAVSVTSGNLTVNSGAIVGLGGFQASSGTLLAPSYAFGSDSDTGFYLIGEDHLGLGMAGTKVVDITPTATAFTGSLSTTGTVTAGTGLVVSAGSVSLPAASVSNSALATPPKLTKEFIGQGSASTTTLVFAHGLGAVPKVLDVTLVCVNPAGGYALGDEVDIKDPYFGSFARYYYVQRDATNVTVRIDPNATATFTMVSASGAITAFSPANWNVKVRAYQ
jgi:hypothetical protein